MLLTVQKGFRGGICHSIIKCAKDNDKSMQDYGKNEESTCKYWDVIISMVGKCHKSCL